MEYYSAVNKEEVLPFLTIWVNLEDIALSGIIQTETDNLIYTRAQKQKHRKRDPMCRHQRQGGDGDAIG